MRANEAVVSNHRWPARCNGDGALEDVCLQAHSAVQWLARVANSYVEPASGASHLHMDWISAEGAIVTGEIAENTAVEMRLPDLMLQFKEGGVRTRYAVELDDKSPAEIEAWALIELLHRNIDRDRFSKALPYEATHLLSGDAPHFRTEGNEAAFEDLADWLMVADEILRRASERAVASGIGAASPIKLRPADFSLFIRFSPNAGGAGGAVELGFRAGGGGKPGFYTQPAGEGAAVSVPGSVLTVGEIVGGNLDRQDVAAFLALEKQNGASARR